MNQAGTKHVIESLVEWLAPAVLAGALGWSADVADFDQSIVVTATAAAFVAGFLLIRLAGRTGVASLAFDPMPFEVDEVDELLLDDPLAEIALDARVVRLFARQEPEPTPGELVASPAPDAGAALQAALANVRASLR